MIIGFVICGGLVINTSLRSAPNPINWGGAQNISGTNDVNTLGLLINAFNLGPNGVASTTVNGVTFAPFAFPNFTSNTTNNGNYTFSESPGTLTSYNSLGSGSAPASTLPAAYQLLLSSAGSSDLPNTLTLTMSGLTPGQLYLFQWWDNNSSLTTTPNNGGFTTTATAVNSLQLDDNTSNALGGLGQYAIGTFLPNGTSFSINFSTSGNNDPLINAFQVRAIPEPSTCALFSVGALALILKLRSRKLTT